MFKLSFNKKKTDRALEELGTRLKCCTCRRFDHSTIQRSRPSKPNSTFGYMLNLNSKMFYFQFVQGSGLGFKNWKYCQPLKETCGQRKRKAISEIKSNQVQSLLLLISLAYMAKLPRRYVLQ